MYVNQLAIVATHELISYVFWQIDAATGEEETFSSYLQKCTRTALAMKELGIKKNDVVCVCSHNNLNNTVPYVAAQFLGAISSSLHPTTSVDDAQYLLNIIKPKIIFVGTDAVKLMEKCETQAKIVVFGPTHEHLSFVEFLSHREEENEFVPVKIDSVHDTAIVCFSSGTSGLAKGICISHNTFLVQGENYL